MREEAGYDAEVVDVLPGVFRGGTTTHAFFVMRHIGPQGRTERETESVRGVDFETARALIARTTNKVGRARDLAILDAAAAWFRSNEEVVLPDDEVFPFPARSYDCPKPMPPPLAVRLLVPGLPGLSALGLPLQVETITVGFSGHRLFRLQRRNDGIGQRTLLDLAALHWFVRLLVLQRFS